MPEIIEIELYRRAASIIVGRRITAVHVPDPWYCKGVGPGVVSRSLTGATVQRVRRIGKLLLFDLVRDGDGDGNGDGSQSDGGRDNLAAGVVLGLRFGMTGRLVVDGYAPIDALEYGSKRHDPAWVRFGMQFASGWLEMHDPRRLGGVELAPNESVMGLDALTVDAEAFGRALGGGGVAVKARLMDQSRVAGIGNLLADETFWRASIDPARTVSLVAAEERAELHRAMQLVLAELTERGGSHTGDLQAERRLGGICPMDGTELTRRTIGGRTTFSCPAHQR